MIIETGKKVYADIAMTQGEVETLKYAWTILAKIGEVLEPAGYRWVAPATGEVVCVDEFARVLGILSAFAEQEEWESEG
jgi:hypothetical protein